MKGSISIQMSGEYTRYELVKIYLFNEKIDENNFEKIINIIGDEKWLDMNNFMNKIKFEIQNSFVSCSSLYSENHPQHDELIEFINDGEWEIDIVIYNSQMKQYKCKIDIEGSIDIIKECLNKLDLLKIEH
jgi:hypothetical protein